MRISIRTLIAVFWCLSALISARDGPKAGIQFLGEVHSVDVAHHTLTVKHKEIPGYAAQGISEYSIGDEAVLKRLQAGDDIRATVDAANRTLYDIRVIYRPHKK